MVDLGALRQPGGDPVRCAAGHHRRGLTPGLSFLVARPEPVADKRPQLEDFVRRLTLARAWAQSKANVESYGRYLGQAHGHPKGMSRCNGSNGQKSGIVPIDDSVVADEQATIDLYFRSGLIKEKLDARSIVDASFNSAIDRALRDAAPAGQ